MYSKLLSGISVPLAGIIIILMCGMEIQAKKKRSSRNTPKTKQHLNSGTTLELAARETIENLEKSLKRLSYAMDDFDFNRIHVHLYTVYKCFATLDTLAGLSQEPMRDSTLVILSPEQVKKVQSQAFIDSFILSMEKKLTFDSVGTGDSLTAQFKPVVEKPVETTAANAETIERRLFAPEKKRKIDSTKIVLDVPEKGQYPENYVEYEVARLKKKTTAFHRYFDSGEFTASRTELEWIIHSLFKAKPNLIFYIAETRKDNTN